MISYSEFKKEKAVPNGAPLRVYGVLGDGYLQRRITNMLLGWLLPDDVRDFNMDTLDGATATLTDVLARCGNLPFLSEHRVVLVLRADKLEGLGKATDDSDDEEAAPAKPAKGKAKNVADSAGASEKRFIEGIKKLPPTSTLILARTPEAFDVGARKKVVRCISTKVDKAIEAEEKPGDKKSAHGLIVDCSLNKKSKEFATQLVDGEARERGIPLARDAAKHLVERCGVNVELLVSELEKCAARAGWGEPVTVAIVDEMVKKNLQDTIFDFTDALGQRNTPHALGLLRELMATGHAPERILSTLIPHLRQLLQMRALLDAGVRVSPRMADEVPAALARQLPHEGNLPALAATPMKWKVDGLARQAANFTSPHLESALQTALGADLAMKGIEGDGGGSAMIIELAVLKLGR